MRASESPERSSLAPRVSDTVSTAMRTGMKGRVSSIFGIGAALLAGAATLSQDRRPTSPAAGAQNARSAAAGGSALFPAAPGLHGRSIRLAAGGRGRGAWGAGAGRLVRAAGPPCRRPALPLPAASRRPARLAPLPVWRWCAPADGAMHWVRQPYQTLGNKHE